MRLHASSGVVCESGMGRMEAMHSAWHGCASRGEACAVMQCRVASVPISCMHVTFSRKHTATSLSVVHTCSFMTAPHVPVTFSSSALLILPLGDSKLEGQVRLCYALNKDD